jgi:hypothetical protein
MANRYARPVIDWSISVSLASGPISQTALACAIDIHGWARSTLIRSPLATYRQPRPGEELLTLVLSNAPLDSSETISHTSSLTHKHRCRASIATPKNRSVAASGLSAIRAGWSLRASQDHCSAEEGARLQ